MAGLRAVILDVDGTLLDSNDAHAAAWRDVGDALGIPIPFERARPLIGMGGDKVMPRLTGIEKESEEGERISKRRSEIFHERYLDRLQPFPGARALLERMRDDGLKLVVATSADPKEMKKLLERAGVADLIEDATSAGDVDESKPAPDIVEAALEQAGVPAEEVVMIGDTPYDVEAAARAGVRVLAVRCGGWDDAALRGAVAVYDDCADLLARYDESLLGTARDGGDGGGRIGSEDQG